MSRPYWIARLPADAAGRSDADLLARFAAGRDEAAFELLVRRHGPMVLGVCRRVLRDPHDADDAFQATFLVLARKAGSAGRAGVLAGWLHRVAHRAALRVRAGRARRWAREQPSPDELTGRAEPDPALAELGRVLEEEVGKLPARHRAAFVLCGLEGLTGEEAAKALGCPPGTVSSRLTRARERLRARLARRGFAPAAVAAALAAPIPSVSARLIESTVSAAVAFAAGPTPNGPPSRPAAAAEGVIRAMTVQKAQFAALVVAVGILVAGGLVAGAGAQPPAGAAAPPAADVPRGKQENPKGPTLPAVKLVAPGKGGLDRVVQLRASAEPYQRADLFPAATGRVKAVHADLGDKVKAGQLLADLDAPDAELDARHAEAGLMQAEAKQAEAEVRVTIAAAELDAAKAAGAQKEAEAAAARAAIEFRKKQFDRLKLLHERGSVDARALDEAEEHLRAAEGLARAADAGVKAGAAELAVRAGRRELAVAGVRTARADVAAAKVALDRARLALDRARVLAPFDGVVAARNAWPGDAARPEAAAAQPLFTLTRVNPLRVAVKVPERIVTKLTVGTPAEVTFDALPNQPAAAGRLARVAPDVDPRTATARVEVDVANPGGKVVPGMTATVRLSLGKGPADAFRVPAGAVVSLPRPANGTEVGVYVVRGDRARLVPVRPAWSDDKEVEVESGLTADDRVVADPRGLQGDDVPVRVEGR